MSGPALPVPRLVPRGVEALERRARALSGAGGRPGAEGATARDVITFRLDGVACAVDARLVERAVLRLASLVSVPLSDGGERAVAFVDERPVPVLDLAGFAARAARGPEALRAGPALVVAGPEGRVALAVDGPLELASEPLEASAPDDAGDRVQIAGRLAGGAALLRPAWLLAWVREAASP